MKGDDIRGPVVCLFGRWLEAFSFKEGADFELILASRIRTTERRHRILRGGPLAKGVDLRGIMVELRGRIRW